MILMEVESDIRFFYAVSAPLAAVRECLAYPAPSPVSDQSSGQTLSALRAICATIPFPPWATLQSEKVVDTVASVPTVRGGREEQEPSEDMMDISQPPESTSISASSTSMMSSKLTMPQAPSLGATLQKEDSKHNFVIGVTSNNKYAFRIRADPLPSHGEEQRLVWTCINKTSLYRNVDWF